MQISFYGAVRVTTGTSHLIEVNGKKVLLDCGLRQGRRWETYEKNLRFPFEPDSIDAVILSHAHIDHSGRLPKLHKEGFSGNIYSTPATLDLCSIMLRDSAHIQERDAEFINKKSKKRGGPPVPPLYTIKEAEKVMRHFIGIGYRRWFSPIPGIRCTFYDAGHILGSAVVLLEVDGNGKDSASKRILFTGDLGRNGMPILRDPEVVDGMDILITESTYGNRVHDSVQDTESKLEAAVNKVCARKGKIVIPAFSVGRTQNIVYSLHNLHLQGRIPEIPIIIDSPLSVNATEVFKTHPECYDEAAKDIVREDNDLFGFGKVRYITQVEESKALNNIPAPAIIISASGMCETGRILHHLKNNIGDSNNMVIIVGYQAENTMGRRLVEKVSSVKIFSQAHEIKAEVVTINGYSAHADRNELLDYADRVNGSLKQIFVVHGEEHQSLPLAKHLQKRHPNVIVPHEGESFQI